jgi:outer membrane receptor for monomeric catechols
MQLVTKTQYAAMNDWDKSYLSKKDIVERLKTAMTPDPQNPEKKLVDVEKADLIFKITRDPSRYLNEPTAATPPGATPAQETFTDAKRDPHAGPPRARKARPGATPRRTA